MIKLNANIKLEGEYNIVINRSDGSKEETGWFKNLITNVGLDRLGGGSAVFNYAQVGSGTTPPVVTNTTLETYVASSNYTNGALSYTNSGNPLYYGQQTFAFAFSQGSVVGTISEVGVSYDNNPGSQVFSRALIVDGGGNPTTLSLTSIDQLTIFYRLRFYPTVTDTTGTVNIGATPYNYTIRIANSGIWGNEQLFASSAPRFSKAAGCTFYLPGTTLNPITDNGMNGSFAGATYFLSYQNPGDITYGSYTPGSYYLDSTFNAGTNVANGAGGFQGMFFLWGQLNAMFTFQMLFDNPIPKDNTKQFTLTMRFSWNRI